MEVLVIDRQSTLPPNLRAWRLLEERLLYLTLESFLKALLEMQSSWVGWPVMRTDQGVFWMMLWDVGDRLLSQDHRRWSRRQLSSHEQFQRLRPTPARWEGLNARPERNQHADEGGGCGCGGGSPRGHWAVEPRSPYRAVCGSKGCFRRDSRLSSP